MPHGAADHAAVTCTLLFMQDAPNQAVMCAAEAMGTRFEIVIPAISQGDAQSGTDRAVRAQAAAEAALEEIRHWHSRLSAFDSSSFVSHLNRHAAARAVECDPDVLELLSLCREVWEQSGGCFDPGLGGLMRAAGFREDRAGGGGDSAARDAAAVADSAELAAARGRGGMRHIELDAKSRTVRFAHPDLALDLGAVAKGWALDRAGEVLRSAGVTAALIHGGTSSVLALGAPPDPDQQAGWLVAIADPPRGASGANPDPQARLARSTSHLHARLRDGALGVSAPHGRLRLGTDGTPHGHVLDPRSGASAKRCLAAAVACVNPAERHAAALCDAWSTALLVEPGLLVGLPAGLHGAVCEPAAGPTAATAWIVSEPHAQKVFVRKSEPTHDRK